jgi:type II secretory pathway component PulM
MATPEPDVPQVKDKRASIAGLLPRNTQALVLGGLAVLMVLVMMFSGQKAAKPMTPPNPAASVIDPSQARIQEYRQKLDEQTRQLAAEEARLTQAKDAVDVRAGGEPGSSGSPQVVTGNQPARAVDTDPPSNERTSKSTAPNASTYPSSRRIWP